MDIHKYKRETFLKRIDTKYGTGIKLHTISRHEDLDCFKPLDDGSLPLNLGVAYNFNPLIGANEFVRTGSRQDKQNAKLTQKHYELNGYDCVKVNDNEVLYWTPGAVIPLMYVTISAHRICIACRDQTLDSKGYKCSKQHFYCWECFGDYIKSALDPDHIGQPYDDEGNINCSECKELYQIHELARIAPKEVLDNLMKLKVQVKERQVRDETEKDVTKRMEEEFARIQALSAEEREIELLRLGIINDILTLKCPRCKVAFTEFDGCFALKCGNTLCKAAFCAWCLSDCGENAHPHLRTCPENRTGDYFGSQEDFKQHHRIKRHRAAYNKISQLPASSQKILKERMARDFMDLSININIPPI